MQMCSDLVCLHFERQQIYTNIYIHITLLYKYIYTTFFYRMGQRNQTGNTIKLRHRRKCTATDDAHANIVRQAIHGSYNMQLTVASHTRMTTELEAPTHQSRAHSFLAHISACKVLHTHIHKYIHAFSFAGFGALRLNYSHSVTHPYPSPP